MWIETEIHLMVQHQYLVTPPAGVWIETRHVRGGCYLREVTPPAGVWIETYWSRPCYRDTTSLPLRECGLKHLMLITLMNLVWSLPLRECGLKLAVNSTELAAR